MPQRHAQHQQWSPGRLLNWAQDIGPQVLLWVQQRIEEKEHPEQAYRVVLGLLSLKRAYSARRLEQACRIANERSLGRLKNVKSILRSNLDQSPESGPVAPACELPQSHENIRGPKSFH